MCLYYAFVFSRALPVDIDSYASIQTTDVRKPTVRVSPLKFKRRPTVVFGKTQSVWVFDRVRTNNNVTTTGSRRADFTVQIERSSPKTASYKWNDTRAKFRYAFVNDTGTGTVAVAKRIRQWNKSNVASRRFTIQYGGATGCFIF